MFVLLAFLFPSLAFAMSFWKMRGMDFKVAFYMMAVMCGLTITIEYGTDFSGDIIRNIEDVDTYGKMGWEEVFTRADFAVVVITKLLVFLGLSKRAIMVTYYLIYAWLFLKSFDIVAGNVESVREVRSLLSFAALLLVIPFTFINSLRFSFATLVFLWGTLEVVVRKRKGFYAMLCLPPFIHFAYWIFVPLPFLFHFLKEKPKVVWVVFVVSVLFSGSSLSYAMYGFASSYMSSSVSENMSYYASEEGLSTMNERYANIAMESNTNRAISEIIYDIRNNVPMFVVFIISILIYRKDCKNELLPALSLCLLAYSMANIANSSSNGFRFYHISIAITVFLLFYYVQNYKGNDGVVGLALEHNRLLINLVFAITFLYGLFTIYMFRKGFAYDYLVFANPLITMFFKN